MLLCKPSLQLVLLGCLAGTSYGTGLSSHLIQQLNSEVVNILLAEIGAGVGAALGVRKPTRFLMMGQGAYLSFPMTRKLKTNYVRYKII